MQICSVLLPSYLTFLSLQIHGIEMDVSSGRRKWNHRWRLRTNWGIAVVAFLSQFILSFSERNAGFLYVGYMELFLVHRQLAIWPQTVYFVVGYPAGERSTLPYVCLRLERVCFIREPGLCSKRECSQTSKRKNTTVSLSPKEATC